MGGPAIPEEVKRELLNKEIKFVLRVSIVGNIDQLFVSKDSWPLLRDYGIIPEDHGLKVRLKRMLIDQETIEIYPKRDLVQEFSEL